MSERKIRHGGRNGSIVAASLARGDDFTGGAATTPPILHAISGSLASALALLLFYPLERARIEMQTAVASVQQQSTSTKLSNDNDNEEGLLSSSSWSLASSSSPSSSNSSRSSPLSNNNNNNNDCKTNETKKEETEVQQQQTILSCLLGLLERGNIYRGAAPVCITMAISNFVFFYAHNAVKRFLLSSSLLTNNKSQRQQHRYGSSSGVVVQEVQPSMAMSLLASSLAGIVNVLVTNPLWVSNIRIIQGCSSTSNEKEDTTGDEPETTSSNTTTIAISQSKSTSSYLLLFQEMISIMKQEGLPSLWNGTSASLLLVSNPVIQFFMYEQLKVVRLSGLTASMVPRLTPLEAFFIGALAKAAATVITYPLQLAQVLLRLQTQKQEAAKQEESSSSSSSQNKNKGTTLTDTTQNDDKNTTVSLYNGTLDCFQQLYANGGLQALYAGMNAKLLQTVLTAATTFLSYEQILRVVRVSYIVLQTKQKRAKSSR